MLALIEIKNLVVELFKPLLVTGAINFPLEKIFPIDKAKKFWRKDSRIDILFYIVTAFTIQIPFWVGTWFSSKVLSYIFVTRIDIFKGYGILLSFPIWLKIILLALIHDLINYWIHFTLHHTKLWRLHIIHHSSTKLDFLSALRTHAGETFIMIFIRNSVLLLLGFSLPVILSYEVVFGFIGLAIHSNIKLIPGPLRYIFVSPVFHHWHHTIEEAHINKNFALVFSFWDYLFGTFYMPKNKSTTYGVTDELPKNFLGLLLHPFKLSKRTGSM